MASLSHWIKHRHADSVEVWVKMLAGLRKEFRDHAALMALATSAEEKYVFPRQEGRLAMSHNLEAACRRQVGKGGGDWFDTTSQNSAWQIVANFYRSAGDPGKAERIEREMKPRRDSANRKTI